MENDPIKKEHREFVVIRHSNEQQPVASANIPTTPGTMRRPSTGSPAGRMLTGQEYANIIPMLEDIPDAADALRIKSMFTMFTKYGTLNALINERSIYLAKYPQQIAKIVDAAVANDIKATKEFPRNVR